MINILSVDFNLKINRKKYFYNLKCKVFFSHLYFSVIVFIL